jgi:hypothetical protein
MVVKRKINQWTMMIYALQEIEELDNAPCEFRCGWTLMEGARCSFRRRVKLGLGFFVALVGI